MNSLALVVRLEHPQTQALVRAAEQENDYESQELAPLAQEPAP